jgi:hypothetical protein
MTIKNLCCGGKGFFIITLLYQTQNKNSYILLNYVIEIGCLYKKLLIGFGIILCDKHRITEL